MHNRLPPAKLKQLADAFLQGRDQTYSPKVQSMLREAGRVVREDFEKIPVEVRWTNRDPYASYQEMRDQVLSTRVLYIWTGASDVPMWDPETNWKARAVHDWDHISNAFDFTMRGEFEGYRSAARKNPRLAPIYLSEIAMQAAVANAYGTFAPEQKIVMIEDPALRKYIESLSGLGSVAPTRVKRLGRRIADIAVLVTLGGPPLAMAKLGEAGYTYEDALVMLDAALVLNAEIQGSMEARR